MPALSLVMPFKGQRDINFALALATKIAVFEMRKHPGKIPWLYQSGIRYRRDVCKAPGVDGACERFLSPLQLIKERFGDCDDIAPYRAAELIVRRGENAKARAIRSPGVGWHVIVKRANGKIEDPSKRLGMKGKG